MPKKFGNNTKSEEARARKDAVKQTEKSKKQLEAEEALWKDDDKSLQRKQQRKDEQEKRRLEQLERKNLNKALYEEEMSSVKAAKPVASKVTRADIDQHLVNQASKKEGSSAPTEIPLEENINRVMVDGEEARSITDAISILSVSQDKADRHPERRMKAAYDAFETENLPRLKAENPNLRLSQLKQMLKKDWMKSPENPLNQRHLEYNSKR